MNLKYNSKTNKTLTNYSSAIQIKWFANQFNWIKWTGSYTWFANHTSWHFL